MIAGMALPWGWEIEARAWVKPALERLVSAGLGVAGALLGFLGLGFGRAWAGEPGLKQELLRVVFREESFVGVNANDAAAAFKVLAQTVGRRRGYEVIPEVSVLDTETAFLEALKTGAFDLAVVDPWVYVEHRLDSVVRLDFVAEELEGPAKRFLVLTRADSGLTNLASLGGRRMMALKQAHADMGRRWLETTTRLAGLGPAEEFFGAREGAMKPAGVVLPVFFSKCDAALVDAGSFRLMTELNPQVGKAVVPILTSEPLSNVLVGTRAGAWVSEEFRRDLVSAMGELSAEVAGQQVLVLFKIKALVPVPDHQLETVRALQAAERKAGLNPAQTAAVVAEISGEGGKR